MSGPRRERLAALCSVRALVAATAVSVTLATTNFTDPVVVGGDRTSDHRGDPPHGPGSPS